MGVIEIRNEDCNITLDRLVERGQTIDIVLTSPPYNTCRDIPRTASSLHHRDSRYDEYRESMTITEYMNWTVGIFNKIDKVLSTNGVILYNISYGTETIEKSETMWRTITAILDSTPFTVADRIIWKKTNAIPNNVSPNKLTRIVEDVFVFCRKSEFKTYNMNKSVAKIGSKTGQKFYSNVFNFVEAKNNDGKCDLNFATYSTELCEKLLSMYGNEGMTIYDPFCGTGTTGVACKNLGMDFIGSEISTSQCEYAEHRLSLTNRNFSKTTLALNFGDM